jgi:hypothetical protein
MKDSRTNLNPKSKLWLSDEMSNEHGKLWKNKGVVILSAGWGAGAPPFFEN